MGYKIVFVLVLSFLSILNCRRFDRDNGDNNNQQQEEWDPRNISRNEGGSYVFSIVVDNEGKVHLVWSDDTPLIL